MTMNLSELSTQRFYQQPSQQLCRDLNWLLFSENIVTDTFFQPHRQVRWNTQQITELKLFLDKVSVAHEAYDKRFNRLGMYAEYLLKLALQQVSSIDLVLDHFPIRDESKTIGEIDYLWQDRQSLLFYHWELAIKFYLYIPSDKPLLKHFIGPQQKDNLDRKTGHLKHHQLLLSDHPLVQAYAPTSYKQAYFKGWLFYPKANNFNDDKYHLAPNSVQEQLNPHHNQGWWMSINDFLNSPEKHHRWAILSRQQWLSPVCISENSTYSTSQIKQHLCDYFSQPPKQPNTACNQLGFTATIAHQELSPIMVAQVQALDTNATIWVESNRGFIVDQHWLEQAQQQVSQVTA